MAIKIECTRCGFKNELGKVFCAQCGQRLELKHTSMDDLSDRAEFDWARLVRILVGTAIILVLGGVVGLALWPRPVPAVKLDPALASAIPQKVRWLKVVMRTQRQATTIMLEREINAFLAPRCAPNHLKALWMDIRPGEFQVGAVRTVAPMTNTPALKNVAFTVSYDVTGTFDKGRLVVRKAEIGHLGLLGPVAGLPQQWLAAVFPDILSETNLIASLKNVRLDEDQAEVTAGR